MNINEITFEVKAVEGTELFEYKFKNVPDYETITFYMDEDVNATTLEELLAGLSIINPHHFRSMSGAYNTPLGRLMINGDHNLGSYEALLEVVEMYSE
jgi:hypothetical protein